MNNHNEEERTMRTEIFTRAELIEAAGTASLAVDTLAPWNVAWAFVELDGGHGAIAFESMDDFRVWLDSREAIA